MLCGRGVAETFGRRTISSRDYLVEGTVWSGEYLQLSQAYLVSETVQLHGANLVSATSEPGTLVSGTI